MIQSWTNEGYSHERVERRGVSPPWNLKGAEIPRRAYAAPLARPYPRLNHAHYKTVIWIQVESEGAASFEAAPGNGWVLNFMRHAPYMPESRL